LTWKVSFWYNAFAATPCPFADVDGALARASVGQLLTGQGSVFRPIPTPPFEIKGGEAQVS